MTCSHEDDIQFWHFWNLSTRMKNKSSLFALFLQWIDSEKLRKEKKKLYFGFFFVSILFCIGWFRFHFIRFVYYHQLILFSFNVNGHIYCDCHYFFFRSFDRFIYQFTISTHCVLHTIHMLTRILSAVLNAKAFDNMPCTVIRQRYHLYYRLAFLWTIILVIGHVTQKTYHLKTAKMCVIINRKK